MASSPTAGTLSTADRAVLWLILAFAGAVALLATLGAALSARDVLGTGPLQVTDMEIGNAATPPFTERLPAITEARYESVAVTVDGAPEAARWLLWGSYTADAVVIIGVCLALAWLCWRVLHGRPFGRSLTVATATVAILVAIGGLAGQWLAAIGRGEIVAHLGLDATAGDSTDGGSQEGFLLLAMEISLAPLGVAAGLAVLAAAFQIGARMQRDTAGLV